ncbi:MAG: hypothetical protein WBZ37_11645 [Mycobacterium sp.]
MRDLREDGDAEQQRREVIDDMVAAGGDRSHLESLTGEQFVRMLAIMALTNADTLRQSDPDGTGVLVDGCREQTDDEIRVAFEGDSGD